MIVGQVLSDAGILDADSDHLDPRLPHPRDGGLGSGTIARVSVGEGDADLAWFPAETEFAPRPPESVAESGAPGTGDVEAVVIRLLPVINQGEDAIVEPLEGCNRRADPGNRVESLRRHKTGAGSDPHLGEQACGAHASGTVQKHADCRVDRPFFLFSAKDPGIADSQSGQHPGIQAVSDGGRCGAFLLRCLDETLKAGAQGCRMDAQS